MKTLINTIGIISATVGSAVVWYFIAQVNFADKEEYLKGNGVITIPDPKPADIKKLQREMLMSKVGIALIVIGGTFQVFSNYMYD
jgi:hypothetical protein